MIYALLGLVAFAVGSLTVAFVTGQRQWANERAALYDDIRVAHRTSIRTALARSGVDWDMAESRSAAIDRLADEMIHSSKQEPAPPAEGLG